MSVNVNVNVEVTGQPYHVRALGVAHAEGPNVEAGVALGGSLPRVHNSVSREWKSADGWSWVKLTAFFEDKYWPDPVITFKAEFEVRRATWGNWIKETGYGKQVSITGAVSGNGKRRAVDIGRSVEAHRYTWYDTIWLNRHWGNEIIMDLSFRKTGGYWASSGPRSSEVLGRMTTLLWR